MPPMEFEPTISVWDWAKTIHASDRAAIVISLLKIWLCKIIYNFLMDVLSHFAKKNISCKS
jgi:hypothetical protein